MPITKPKARLKINGFVVPHSTFELQAPTNALGVALQVQLANPAQSINPSHQIEFDIQENTGEPWVPQIASGNLAARRAEVRLRGDRLSINSSNPVADKFALCPRTPVVVYDPDETDIDETTASSRADLLDNDGAAIATTFIPTVDLDLTAILEFVYITTLGFVSIVCTIPTFVIRRVSFSPASTWHEVVAGLFPLYEPYFCPSPDGTVMYVLDPRAEMPIEITLTSLGLGEYVGLQKDLPNARIINAVLLTYKSDVGIGELTTEEDRTEEEDIIVGTELTVGFHKTHITRHIKDILDADDNLMRSVVWKIDLTTYSADPISGMTVEQGQEFQTDIYTADWRLKIGHTRTINARTQLPLGETSPVMTEIGTEVQHNTWAPSRSRPGVDLLVFATTIVEGLILTEGDPEDPNQKVTRVALIDANRAQQVTTDGFQDTTRGPIRTSIEYWRETGNGQVDVHKQIVDHLTGGMDPSSNSQQLGAGAGTNGSGEATQTRLFRDLASESIWGPRKPLQLNAGDVPFSIAGPIAQARLDAGGALLRPAHIELPGYKASVVRGSLLDVADRAGSETVLVTSYRITGGADGSIRMAVDGVIIEA